MTDKAKAKITSLSQKAVEFFLSYENICQKIESLLDKETEEKIQGVLYQKSDGLVVCVNHNGIVPANIPIEDYLREIEK